MVNYKHFFEISAMVRGHEELTVEIVARRLRLPEEEAASIVEGVLGIEELSLEDSLEWMEDRGLKVFLDIIKMRFVQFMMVESTMQNSKSPVATAEAILSAIVRPSEETDITDTNTLEMRAELNNIPAEVIVPIFNEFNKRRDVFHNRTFSGVFYKKKEPLKDGQVEEEEADLAPEEKERARVQKNYHWYNLMDDLSGNDVLKHEAIMQLSMGLVAPKVAKDVTYQRLEYKEQRRQQAKMKSRAR